jgi:hypothetical protein
MEILLRAILHVFTVGSYSLCLSRSLTHSRLILALSEIVVKRVNQLTNLVLVFMPDVGSKNYIYFSNMQRTCQQITQCYRSTILELQHHIAVRMACARHKLHYYPYRLLKKNKIK